jgi:hypothetical protein
VKIRASTLILAMLLGCGGGTASAPDDDGSTGGTNNPTGASSFTTAPPTSTTDDPASSGTPDPTEGGSGSSSTGGDDTGDPPDDDNAPIEPYLPCDTSDDCGGDQVCFDLLGVSVCTHLGCADDESMCGAGASCMVTEAIAPDGVCVNTGADQFCARECSDVLKCNLDAACAEAGCCVDVDENGCPSMCDELMTIECEISPQCDVACCGG